MRFKRILSPDYQEDFECKDEEESDAREGTLKMALHFLKSMNQKDLAEKLQENEMDVLCQAELKQNLKNKYQSVFEGIQKQGSSALLEKMYTEVYITEGGSGKVNEEHEVRQIESRSRTSTGQETSIKCRDMDPIRFAFKFYLQTNTLMNVCKRTAESILTGCITV